MEVLDVIQEHSAVTIFNHTDSTWYVSSRHPSFVRPLHGKHRHGQPNYRQRSPSPSEFSGGVVQERIQVSSPNLIQCRELRTTPGDSSGGGQRTRGGGQLPGQV